jgi:hypothetical protein
MVYIQAVKKRGFLRQIAECAKRNSSTLKESLLAAQAAVFTANFQRGRLLVSTSGSGQSGSFEIGVQGKEFTQDNIFALFEELLEICDDIVNAGLAADTGTPTDTDVLSAEMIGDDRLQGITERGLDVTLIGTPRWGSGGLL